MTEWRTIPSFPHYEASSEGEIRRRGSERPLIVWPIAKGSLYLKANVYRDRRPVTKSVNNLVCEAFHGRAPSDRHQAAHNDSNPANNDPANLSWKTPAENEADKVNNGTAPRGSQNPMAQLSEAEVEQIRAEYASLPRPFGRRTLSGSVAELAKKHGISRTYLHDIVKLRRWAHFDRAAIERGLAYLAP